MTQTLKEGDKVVIIGTWLGVMLPAESGDVLKLGGLDDGLSQLVHVKLESGEIVSVPVRYVHLPA